MSDRLDLNALIGSRICHDLISPIGAIGNGVELLQMDGAARSPEMTLIAESVAQANARIRLFRIAFGSASSGQRIGRPEVVSILTGLTRGGRLELVWNSPQDLARTEVKLALLLLMCLETALSHGGKIVIERSDTRWTLTATAPRMRVDPALWEVLSNPAAPHDITPAQVHFALLREELARQGRKLVAEIRETEIRLGLAV
ncbi:histidine phosphotransferase family protein [Gemmobacter serpentinus]|uniref:histidine phosphotransferase family protein n=1 Tax=Gemmobacter serpentinus TaxID=2652247 RepID=UPI00124DAEE7|nr:histidine phosphotransferase family protein [Gemmobacter serpentinus]